MPSARQRLALHVLTTLPASARFNQNPTQERSICNERLRMKVTTDGLATMGWVTFRLSNGYFFD